MKKLATLILALVITGMLLAGCAGVSKSSKSPDCGTFLLVDGRVKSQDPCGE